ncbi:MAG: hypothetical protein ABSH47_13920 [Bryobacteraceae bacterium]
MLQTLHSNLKVAALVAYSNPEMSLKVEDDSKAYSNPEMSLKVEDDSNAE